MPALVLLALFVVAALGQCGRTTPPTSNDPHNACGGPGSHPVAIGGVLVVACQ